MSYPGLEVWTVPETEFPEGGGAEEKLKLVLRYAILAPSGHNSQPWRFGVRRGRIELVADRNRTLWMVDPEGRELTMSCGAALFFLRLALRHFGYAGAVALLPDPGNPDLLATVELGERAEISLEDEALFQAIPERRTHRAAFEDRNVSDVLLNALRAAAESEGAWLQVVDDPDARERVAELVAEGDRRQFADRGFRKELAGWVSSNRDERRDGVPGYGFGFSDGVSRLGPFIMGAFDWGPVWGRRDRRVVMRAPVLVVLGTESDEPLDWLRAGQALGRVLLRAQNDGVYASHLNQPIELEALRRRLRDAIGRPRAFPQLLLRMGYGHAVVPTPRRRVEEVLDPA